MRNRLDPFASRFDGVNIIGACDCSPSSIVGFDLKGAINIDAPKLELPDVGIDELEKTVKKETDKTIGTAVNKAVQAKETVDQAIAAGQNISKAVDDFDHTAKDIGQAIKDVAGSPITHAVIGGVAVAAPPVSTAVAAVMEAGVAIAVGVVELVEEVESIVSGIVGWAECLFGCETPEQQNARYRAEAAARDKLVREQARARSEPRRKKQKAAAEAFAKLKLAGANGDKKALAASLTLEQLMRKEVLIYTVVMSVVAKRELNKLAAKGCTVEKVLEAKRNPGLGLAQVQVMSCKIQLAAMMAMPKLTAKVMKDRTLRKAMSEWKDIEKESTKRMKELEALAKKAGVTKKQLEDAKKPKRKHAPGKRQLVSKEVSKYGKMFQGKVVAPGGTPRSGVWTKKSSDVSKHFLVDPDGRVIFGEYQKVS